MFQMTKFWALQNYSMMSLHWITLTGYTLVKSVYITILILLLSWLVLFIHYLPKCRSRLVNMCKYMGISPFGTDAYLRYMLRKRLQE